MRFGQDIGGGEVEQESGEVSQVHADQLFRDFDERARDGAERRGDGIGDQQDDAAPAVVAVQRGDGEGIEAVREIVADHRQRHRESDRATGLEAEADAQAVQEAVEHQPGSGQQADGGEIVVVRTEFVLVPAVQRHPLLQDVHGEEADHGGQNGHGDAEGDAGVLFEGLRQEIEGHHAEHEPGGQAEDEAFAFPDMDGHEPADKRRAHRHQCQQNRHSPSMPTGRHMPGAPRRIRRPQ